MSTEQTSRRFRTNFRIYIELDHVLVSTLKTAKDSKEEKEFMESQAASLYEKGEFYYLNHSTYVGKTLMDTVVRMMGNMDYIKIITTSTTHFAKKLSCEKILFTYTNINTEVKIDNKSDIEMLLTKSDVLPNQCILIDSDLSYCQEWQRLGGRSIHHKTDAKTIEELTGLLGLH